MVDYDLELLSPKIDLTKSCHERGDYIQNCHTCPDKTCCDNINPTLL